MFFNIVKTIASFFAKIIFPTKITYEAPIPNDGPLIICGKHIANSDGPLTLLFFPRKVNFMAKSELFKNPVIGGFLRIMGAFPVVRGVGDIGALKAALTVLKSGGVLGIFPEGTCMKNNDRAIAKTGVMNIAFKTKATILPFGIYTKNYRRKPFKKAYVRYGKPLTFEELGFTDGNKAELRRITDMVMEKVYDMSEEFYESNIS